MVTLSSYYIMVQTKIVRPPMIPAKLTPNAAAPLLAAQSIQVSTCVDDNINVKAILRARTVIVVNYCYFLPGLVALVDFTSATETVPKLLPK